MRRQTGRRLIGVSVLGLLLAACAGQTVPPGATPPRVASAVPAEAAALSPLRRQVLAEAGRQLGVPYRYGGTDRRGFDCSGLVYFTHRRAGIRVPRTTRDQFAAARPVLLDRLRPGDLLFFRIGGKGRHIGIYAGNGEFIHAPSSGKRVSRARLDNPYWRRHLLGAGSFL
ncbi:C40 family peptidase [Thiohalobacter sp. IOR34]|uniref:C40 family peptidase n=1 Tax=Thiohalobacter sp. IOR34 TaxID=3057176 RepID=UPI0025B049DC|nr:C40 family peptidase [Thiohalobacter sp. IOR34]WJW74980.1 C40 family peptidase [Thiohalobacter sp. IOR34]